MSDISFNLDDQIANIIKRREELNECWIDPPGPTPDEKSVQRDEIEVWRSQLTEERTSLERIRANRDAAEVIVRAPTDAERNRIETALKDLNRVIQRTQTFIKITENVTAILNAIGSIEGVA